MCFYNDDYEWCASYQDQETRIAESPRKCMECGKVIAAGESYFWIYQQQYEECRVCEWEEAEEPCEKHDYGETYEYWRCATCSKILKVIEDLEAKEGCPPNAQQPPFEELSEVFFSQSDAAKYAKAVVERHPELANHEFVREGLERERVWDG